jgi:ketosteroid isomerase-like protein
MIPALFAAIDARDVPAFARFLAPECLFRFGNQPPVRGHARVCAHVADFFDSIGALRHRLTETWTCGDTHVCHGEVCYTRHDGSVLCVPFCNVLKTEGGLIREYLIFADTSALYTPG